MEKEPSLLLSGEVLEEEVELSLTEFCQVCHVTETRVFELVEEGIIEPLGRAPVHWRFRGVSIRRVHRVQRLEDDLGINDAGAALALDLIEELEHLRARLRRFET